MKINGRSPFSILMRNDWLFDKVAGVSVQGGNISPSYTPIMGWSAAFAGKITDSQIMDAARQIKDKGLLDAGYNYIYLCGEGQSDRLDELVTQLREQGFKVGVTSDYIRDDGAFVDRETKERVYDELVKSGVELYGLSSQYVDRPVKYAIVIGGMWLTGDGVGMEIDLLSGKTTGLSKIRQDRDGVRITGLDGGHGQVDYTVEVPVDGEYTLRVRTMLHGTVDRLLVAEYGKGEYSLLMSPMESEEEYVSCIVSLRAGVNKISLYNPISTRRDEVMLYADQVGKAIRRAVMSGAVQNSSVRQMLYYLDLKGAHGVNRWGHLIGNCWSTAKNNTPSFDKVKRIYGRNIRYYAMTGSGRQCSAGELYLGLGKLSQRHAIAQFSLWCMLASPLMISADIKSLSDKELEILTNSEMLDIARDGLVRAAKRIKAGTIDLIARPLSNGDVAVCIFNKLMTKSFYNFKLESLIKDEYIRLIPAREYNAYDVWHGRREVVTGSLCGSIDGESVRVFRLSKKQ